MTSRLPADLLRLFTPRPPLKYLEPLDKSAEEKPKPPITGIAQYVAELQNAPKGEHIETPKERKERLKQERAIQAKDAIVRGLSNWDPNLNLQATEDPYKTIIVGRLNYDTTEKSLREEFEEFGPITSLKMVMDLNGNFRGYAFIEFDRESDMRDAYRAADGIRILGRRIVVDVERGRTVKGWLPRRFAGGLGGTRIGDAEKNQKNPGRFDPAVPAEDKKYEPRRSRSTYSRSRDSPDRYRDRNSYRPHRSNGYSSRSRDYRRDYERSRERSRNRSRDRDHDHRDYKHNRSRSPSSRHSRRY